ncbi:hypothetical protein DICPUDRAFT_77743 [Dictyostelium purpureum]|uniref:Phosphatidylserine decarboxylase proenzyme 2 n=1 Tax=Dictyostelium purpureum TaxID=5786 RepID=F0ZHH3_DICPU|nr:uncharacterized protein DICPUDRAFT_77743 [Dictyostelium purpureum]EGC36631.1 hypothetical protein DICPUDRAFT_77743 [Dictyostelium purpureum]|eukprot:XP_003286869.1 hypothetical protein DICPUDRAFT_77743 [Dictyostelium purpureum]
MDKVQSILSIKICGAKNLPKMDLNGYADPYCEIVFENQVVYKTNIIKKTLNPTWNDAHYNLLVHESKSKYDLTIKLWDWDKTSKNDFIGQVTIPMEELLQTPIQDKWLNVSKVKKNGKIKERGEVHILTKVISEHEVYDTFVSSISKHFSHTEDETLNIADFTGLITTLNPDFPETEIEELFKKTDADQNETISVSELKELFTNTLEGKKLIETLLQDNTDLIWEAYQVSDSYSTIADNIFHKDMGGTLKSTDKGRKVKVIYVHNRETGKLEEEKIPHYIEVSLRIMYSTSTGRTAIGNSQVKRLMRYLTNKTGRKYESLESVKEIAPFIKFHNLNTDEILDPINSFINFNQFFYRKLKPSARPIAEPNNSKIAVCPADCRLNVFSTIKISTELWIKGKSFSLQSLVQDEKLAQEFEDGSLVIARLAPQDYHRFHVPVDGVIGRSIPIDGELYTVNPIAIRENVDVYCENKRVVTEIISNEFEKVLFVSVGATLVGSIQLTNATPGQKVKKGDELGYFAFGGSTILLLFKKNTIEFDNDLLVNSLKPIETLVKVNTSLGKSLLQ